MPTANTIPVSTTTPTALATAPPLPVEAADWLTTQQAILRAAPDSDTAFRGLFAAALGQIAVLTAQLLEARRPALPARPSTPRPAILALLQARLEQQRFWTPAQLTAALGAPRPLTDVLKNMAAAGLLTRTNGLYALPEAEEPAAIANGPEPRRGGRPRRAPA